MTTSLFPQATNIRDVQVEQISNHTTIFRSRTWERLKFDKVALIDPPGESFTQIFLENLQQHLNLQELDYVIVGHINANRMTTLKQILEIAPQIQVIGSKPAVKSLKAVFPQYNSQFTTANHDLDL